LKSNADENFIPFAIPSISREEEEAILRVLHSGWLTTGNEALQFEKEFEAYMAELAQQESGSFRALAVNSCTSALHLAQEACGLGTGTISLVPSLTFTSTAEVVRYLGGEVRFVDVERDSFHISAKTIEETLSSLSEEELDNCRTLCLVHYGGYQCAMPEIKTIAERYGLKLIEDAAHALPLLNGPQGDIACFSFYATKTITTGEGGMIVSSNEGYIEKMRSLRSHGIDRNTFSRYTDKAASWYYRVMAPGYKYNLPDLLAAIGRVQLAKADLLSERRAYIAAKYNRAFSEDTGLRIPPWELNKCAWHLYPLRLNLEALRIDRNEFFERLQKKGVGLSVHFIPLHTMPYYKERYHYQDEELENTMEVFNQEISLPIWPDMSTSQVDAVIESVLELSREYAV
jgi:dTDP-4-amino-4,6-dideoxygalactose transaminase